MQTWIDHYCRVLQALMVAFLGLMVLMVFGNVVLRYAFNSGITMSEELSRWLFVWMTFLGAVVAVRDRGHLGTDALLSRLPAGGRRACYAISHLLMLYVCWLILQGSWEQARINWTSTSAVMEASMAIFYGSGVVFAVSAAPMLFLNLWRLVTGQVPDADLIGMRESEEKADAVQADGAKS